MRIASSVLTLSLVALLAGCGGSDEGIIVDDRDPTASGLSASLTVTSASNVALNGLYSTDNVFLNNVTKVNPIGGDPETCRFRFSNLQQQGSTRSLKGDVRYIPGTDDLRTTFIDIDTIGFVLEGTTGARVDRANNRVVFAGAVLTSTQGTGQTITLNGAVPMRGDRPEGC